MSVIYPSYLKNKVICPSNYLPHALALVDAAVSSVQKVCLKKRVIVCKKPQNVLWVVFRSELPQSQFLDLKISEKSEKMPLQRQGIVCLIN